MIYDLFLFFFFKKKSSSRRFNLIEPKEMEVLADLELALHLSDDVSTTPSTCSVTSNNNSSSSCNSNCNLNSNTVTQAIISSSSSPLRSIGGITTTTNSTSINTPLDGGLNVHNSQNDNVTVIVKQPLISDSATSMLNNNNDLAMKDRVLVSTSVDTQPI